MTVLSRAQGEAISGWRQRTGPVAAVALGAAVPLLVFGRTALAAAAAVAILGLLFAIPRAQLVPGINRAMASPLGGMVWLTFALWLVSVAGSGELGRSLVVWLRMAALLTVGTGLCTVLRARPDLHTMALKALGAGALGCGLVGLVALAVASDPYVWLMGHGDEREISGIAAAVMKSYGTALALAMPTVLWAGFRLPHGWRLPALTFQAVALVLLFVLESRAGLLAAGLGGGVFGCWLALRLRHGRLVLLLVPLIVAVVIAVFLDNQRNNDMEAALGLPTWLVDSHRQTIWAFSMSYFDQAPWFGVGLDTINLLPGAAEVIPGAYVEYVPSHPHNFVVEVLVETGAVGLAAMTASLIVLAAGLIRATRRDGAAGATLLALCAAFWFVNLVSYSFWSYWWQASWVLLMALVAATAAPGQVSGGLRRSTGR